MLQGSMRASSGSKPIRNRPELGLEDWLQNRFNRALYDAIFHRRNTQRSELPWFTGFGNELPS
jgi:hypothetical protein